YRVARNSASAVLPSARPIGVFDCGKLYSVKRVLLMINYGCNNISNVVQLSGLAALKVLSTRSARSTTVHAGERLGRGIEMDGITTPVINTSAYWFINSCELIDFKEGRHKSFKYGHCPQWWSWRKMRSVSCGGEVGSYTTSALNVKEKGRYFRKGPKNGRGRSQSMRNSKQPGSYWTYGKKGHFRRDCNSSKKDNNEEKDTMNLTEEVSFYEVLLLSYDDVNESWIVN
ncbi:hypothetical protein GIB67_028583, partial [Kingdonia uniflora]